MSADQAPASKTWNVVLPVVANISAPTGQAAAAALARALERAGFSVLDDPALRLGDPFEAEDGTEPDELPAPPRVTETGNWR